MEPNQSKLIMFTWMACSETWLVVVVVVVLDDDDGACANTHTHSENNIHVSYISTSLGECIEREFKNTRTVACTFIHRHTFG